MTLRTVSLFTLFALGLGGAVVVYQRQSKRALEGQSCSSCDARHKNLRERLALPDKPGLVPDTQTTP